MHEAMEVYNYYGSSEYETNRRIKKIWDRFLEYKLGHLHHVMELFKKVENRDPAEVLPATLPEPIDYTSHREFVRETLGKWTFVQTEWSLSIRPTNRSVLLRIANSSILMVRRRAR